jgi:uncharacterized protein (DUF58 family)
MLYPDFNELVHLKSKVSSLKLPSNRLIKSSINGGYFSPFRGHGLEFAEVRQYVSGDDIRKIDWQVTARTNIPHIKLFTEERERTVLLIVDTNSTMSFGTRGTFKSVQAARAAALIGWCANKNSNMVGAILFGGNSGAMEYFRPTRTRRSLWKMLQSLSNPSIGNDRQVIEIDKAIEFANKKVSASSLVFVISDFININEQLKTQLAYLNARCQVILISVNDPSDKDITPAGEILFSSRQAGRLYVDTSNTAGREIYKKQWEDRSLKLKDIEVSLAIQNISLLTDRDVYFDLFYGLKSSGKHRKR